MPHELSILYNQLEVDNCKNPGGGPLSVGEVREVLGVEFTLVTFVTLVVLVHFFLECLKNEPV